MPATYSAGEWCPSRRPSMMLRIFIPKNSNAQGYCRRAYSCDHLAPIIERTTTRKLCVKHLSRLFAHFIGENLAGGRVIGKKVAIDENNTSHLSVWASKLIA